MIPIIYYAHSMKIYHTDREQTELDRLQQYFFTGCIFNPNRPWVQYSENPMRTCFDVVKDPSITALAFSHDAGKIPNGVYAELRSAQKRGIDIYQIDAEDIVLYTGTPTLSKRDRATDWARI